MKIIVSACLLGENCRYDGSNNYDERVVEFLKDHEAIPVCPEVLGGLPTPRTPCELVGPRVVSADGEPMDAQFHKGAQEAMKIAMHEHADFAILQPRSPSCGAHEVYDGTFSSKLVPGEGLFATRLRLIGVDAYEPDELDKLREYLAQDDPWALPDFSSRHKGLKKLLSKIRGE
ncbi:MAG: DUF523 domain-containing protein [Coriobacteriales bacterium]|nr:DUF523 domain-containing protein [Coriobacteriales bacterium]